MARQIDNYAGWRPVYRGSLDSRGYRLEYIAANSPDFPIAKKAQELLKHNLLKNRKLGGLTFIIRKGGTWSQVTPDDENNLFLELLNVECTDDVNVNAKCEIFINRYGPLTYPDPECPNANSEKFDTVEDIIIQSRVLSKTVSDILKSGKDEVAISTGRINIKDLYIDLRTRQAIISTDNIAHFAYMQIADVISRNIPIDNCEQCGAYMMIRNVRRKFCSDACRQKAHRDGR
jgi:hypothetical protein